MEKQSWTTRFLKNIFLIVIIVIGILFLAAQFVRDDGYSFQKPQIVELTENAKLQLSDGTMLDLEKKGDRFSYEEAVAGEVVTVIMTVPEALKENMCIGVFSTNQNIGIYIDGILREYYNDMSHRIIGSFSASYFVMVPLTAADSGKEIRITYETTLKDCAGALACPILGTEADLMLWIFQSYFLQIVSAVLLFVAGIFFIIFGLTITFNRRNNKGLCYLGIFSVIMAVWLLCRSNMRIFYCRNLNATNLMTSLALMVAPIPMLIFFNDLMKYRYQRIYNSVILICMINTTVSMGSYLAGFAALVHIMIPTRILILATFLTCLGCFINYAKKKELKEPKPVAIGLAGFIAATLIEDINLLFHNSFDVGKYIGFGILFFLLMLAYTAEKSWVVQWQDYRKALEENNFKNVFLANMSHEIKTPINTILGMNEMILRESRDQGIKDYADHIYEAGQLLLSLVNNILDYTKLESGKMQIIPVRYEMGQLLSNLINSVNMKAEEKKLRFDIDVDESIPCVLYGDELRIRQAVINLLTNALKYTRQGGILLKVRAERMHQKEICLYISVTDTGIGIRIKDQKKLFDSFVRLEEKRNRSIEGAGLGMTITRQIMNMMHGKIEIESEYGKGSTFTLSFKQKIIEDIPIGRFEDWYRVPFRTKHYENSSYQANGVKILAIDDNEMNLEVIQGLLKKTGAQIDMAHSGEEGLVKADCTQYDLILLDHMMPGMDGVETLQKLQQVTNVKEKKTPVIALTANTVMGAKEDYLKKGFTDYIGKPIDYRTLINLLKKYVPDKIEKCPGMEKEETVGEEYLQQQGIHVKSAMKYAGDEWEQYIHLLEIFADDKSCKKQETLQQVYEACNWKDYTIYVHGLKNGARTIGADTLADMAYEHEQKSKEGDIAFVQDNYLSLMQEWEKTREIIRSYLNSQEKEKMSQDGVTEAGMTEDEWKEMLEQAICYLGEYKKKEAAALLQKLSEGKLAEETRNHVERAIKAVQEYDYECAIHTLREI